MSPLSVQRTTKATLLPTSTQIVGSGSEVTNAAAQKCAELVIVPDIGVRSQTGCCHAANDYMHSYSPFTRRCSASADETAPSMHPPPPHPHPHPPTEWPLRWSRGIRAPNCSAVPGRNTWLQCQHTVQHCRCTLLDRSTHIVEHDTDHRRGSC